MIEFLALYATSVVVAAFFWGRRNANESGGAATLHMMCCAFGWPINIIAALGACLPADDDA